MKEYTNRYGDKFTFELNERGNIQIGKVILNIVDLVCLMTTVKHGKYLRKNMVV
jgi:hypothetical protein